MGSVLSLATFGSECLHRFADEALKVKFLPLVSSAEILASAALGETEIGNDLTTLETTAVRDKDEWIINGSKYNVFNNSTVGFFVVLCRTDPDKDSDRFASMILVENNSEGLNANPLGNKLGLNMMPSVNLIFHNVRVPLGNLIGKEGLGIAQSQAFFDEVRIVAAARAVGIAQGAFDRALVYVKQREQFGKKLAQFQITRHKIANMAAKIETARLVTYHAAWSFDNNKKMDSSLVSIAKNTASKAAVEVADEAIQLLGGYGYMTEQEVERSYRDAKMIELCLGTPGIQKDNIADAVIGKLK